MRITAASQPAGRLDVANRARRYVYEAARTYASIEGIDPAIPSRNNVLLHIKGSISSPGSGSQVDPSWARLGVRLTSTRRAINSLEPASLNRIVRPRDSYHA